MAAALVLPSTGFVLGFTKAQVGAEDDWSSDLEVSHDLLSPTVAGVLALQHGSELKLSDHEKAEILQLVRADAPGLLKAQREDWDMDLKIARNILSGDEIVLEFNTARALRGNREP